MASTPEQYRLVQAIPLIPVGIAFLGSFFLQDTPRWLASNDRHEEALAVLARLRGASTEDAAVMIEFESMHMQMRDQAAALKDSSPLHIIRDVFRDSTYRNRFFLSLSMQVIAQWTGGNGITYYITDIFGYAGITGANTSLITSGAYGIVKLFFTIIFAWALIDYFGRRRCFLTGLVLQCIAHIYMAIYTSHKSVMTSHNASSAAIAVVYIYALGWSIGLCTIPYIYATELFPTRVRGVCYAANMGLHWFCQFAVVRVIPLMFVGLDVWGAYVFFASVCAAGVVILGLCAPETKGVPMERMWELFEGPLLTRWKAEPSTFSLEDIVAQESIKKKPTVEVVERVAE